jgi:hypothetical protein
MLPKAVAERNSLPIRTSLLVNRLGMLSVRFVRRACVGTFLTASELIGGGALIPPVLALA